MKKPTGGHSEGPSKKKSKNLAHGPPEMATVEHVTQKSTTEPTLPPPPICTFPLMKTLPADQQQCQTQPCSNRLHYYKTLRVMI
ncbi:hypothetical protein UPYG_G00320760 [Umbra pygmaea]|uniref:Uncharacterized protein n=1 Tax=Umbra pygmaea TaxID=75934 RepID=A0ABD0W4Q9_UMBPY